ncbi:MAG: hypothetical protein ORN98_04940 [Alphaproteobacteria bacterium]|nr:hypothetical protein [Alphaproteobacteria bacterium]
MSSQNPIIFIAHTLPQIIAIRQFGAALSKPVTWIAPDFLLKIGGVGYVAALRDQAALAMPDVPCQCAVVCGDIAGLAMQALDYGFDAIIYQGSPEVMVKLQSMSLGIAQHHTNVHKRPTTGLVVTEIWSHLPSPACALSTPNVTAPQSQQIADALGEIQGWRAQHK